MITTGAILTIIFFLLISSSCIGGKYYKSRECINHFPAIFFYVMSFLIFSLSFKEWWLLYKWHVIIGHILLSIVWFFVYWFISIYRAANYLKENNVTVEKIEKDFNGYYKAATINKDGSVSLCQPPFDFLFMHGSLFISSVIELVFNSVLTKLYLKLKIAMQAFADSLLPEILKVKK